MPIDATKEFTFPQVHQRTGNYRKQYIDVSDETYNQLEAAEQFGHSTRMKMPYPDNQVIGICSTDADYFSTSPHFVAKNRAAFTAQFANRIDRLQELSSLVDSMKERPEDRDKLKTIQGEIKTINGEHDLEFALMSLKAGTGCCGEYSYVTGFHALIDARKLNLNVEICRLRLKDNVGDHNIISYRDPRVSHRNPRHNLASEILTSDPWSPMGYTSVMSERYSHSAVGDWEAMTLHTPLAPPSLSFYRNLQSMDFDVPKISSDDRRIEIIDQLNDDGELFNRISAASDISAIYRNDSGKEKALCSMPESIANNFRFSLNRRDQVMQRNLALLESKKGNYTDQEVIYKREAIKNKFMAVA